MTDHLPSKDKVALIRRWVEFGETPGRRELFLWAADEIERLQRDLDKALANHTADLSATPEPAAEWGPIETAPTDEEAMFWIRPLTKDETWCNTSGEPIVIDSPPELFVGKRGRWSSLWKATHWMPLPSGPSQPPGDGQT